MKQETNKNNKYECVCGRVFSNSQSLNAHTGHCRVHLLNKYNNADVVENVIKVHEQTQPLLSAAKKRARELNQAKQIRLKQWVEEQHRCEHCGAIMIEKYASGRFCSRSCANAKVHSDETKQKIRNSVLAFASTDKQRSERYINLYRNKSYFSYVNSETIITKLKPNDFCEDGWVKGVVKQNKTDKTISKYMPPKESYSAGYLHNRLSYAEKFWKCVLDNNGIQYIEQYKIKSPNKRGVYRLDFFINSIMLDVEIDGELHARCKEKDAIRTEYLKSIGITTYRIPWINPKTQKKSEQVKEQIDGLLKYIQELS